MICRYPFRFRHRVPVLFAAALLLGAGHVDSVWLAQWNEAQKCRPETLTSHARIAPAGEPGTPMRIEGQVLTRDKAPAARVEVHSYHRDSDGFDFGPGDKDAHTWRLQGWAQTDDDGRFSFDTVRPAADHLGREAAHIHFTLVSKAYGRQWAPKVFVDGDPLITTHQRERSIAAGAFASVVATELVDGVEVLRVYLPLDTAADF